MKKLSIEQMENVNGGETACQLNMMASIQAAHVGDLKYAHMLMLVWMDNCTALGAFIKL